MVYRSSKQSLMSIQLPAASIIPWIWGLEAFASSSHADASLLIDLVTRVPEISDDFGRSARELVSFRILELLFTEKNWNKGDTSLAEGSSIRFDPLESCEGVLKQILTEMSASNMKLSGPEKLKWDVQSFIACKRSTLPKCALLQVKDMLVNGTDPRLAPLKERSGLSGTNQSGNGTSMHGVAVNGTKEGCEDGSFEHPVQNGNLVASIHDNEKSQKEIVPNGERLSTKKRKSNSTNCQGRGSPENRISSENGCHPCTRVTKKSKQSVGFDKDCEHIANCNEKEGHEIETRAGGLEGNGSPLRKSSDDQQQHHCSNSEMPQGTNAQRMVKNICIDAAGVESAHAELRNSNCSEKPLTQQANEIEWQHNFSNGGSGNEIRNNNEFVRGPGPRNDSDEYHEERTEIASKKTAFLSSQCTYSQDSFDVRELNLCMKCQRGGRLLVCGSETCPLVVHESCLGSIPKFEKDGSFYCPFCAYSRAISKYMDAKTKASLAKKDLTAFIGSRTEQPLEIFPAKSSRSKTSQARQGDELCEKGEANRSRAPLDAIIGSPQCRANTEDRRQEMPLVTSACIEDEVDKENAPQSMTNLRHQPETTPSANEEKSSEKEKGNQPEPETTPSANEEKSSEKEERNQPEPEPTPSANEEKSSEKEEGNQPEPSLSADEEEISDEEEGNQTKPIPSADTEESSDEEEGNQTEPTPSTDVDDSSNGNMESSVVSNYCIRFRNKQFSFPTFPQWRRKKVPWTKEEEEALKEGVEKFKSSGNANVPWKEILEFGGDRFWKGRTAVDLKDKWRNISKGSPKKR